MTQLANMQNAVIIWSYFQEKSFTNEGIAGLLGNLYAESHLLPINLQDTGNKALGMTDEEYIQAVDSGAYDCETFFTDGYGVGIAQWTYPSRKEELYKLAKARGVSIGDLDLQLDFLYHELNTNFKPVKLLLETTDSVKTASDCVLLDFEKPEVQDTTVQEKRLEYALIYHTEYVEQESEENKIMLKICLDAGHSGENYNTGGWGYYESARMWELHLLLKKDLESLGIEVVTTRENINDDPSVYDRGAIAKGCDMFLSLHSNACATESVDYPLLICPYDGQNQSEAFGLSLAKTIASVMGTVQDGKTMTKQLASGGEWYGVMRGARAVNCPLYFIVEHSFHTNQNASVWLLSDDNLRKLAAAIAHIVAEKFGISTEAAAPEEDTTTSTQCPPENDPNTPSTWAVDSWQWLTDGKMTDGTNPQGAVTREMLSLILMKYHEKYHGGA